MTVGARHVNPAGARGTFAKVSGLTAPQALPDPDRDYYAVTFSGLDWTLGPGTGVFMTEWRRYDIGGDHFYTADIAGPDAVMVRLGRFSNPPIRVRRGLLLRRKFSQFWVAAIGNQLGGVPGENLYRAQTDALFYVSTGPLIRDEEKDRGGWERAGFVGARDCTAIYQSKLLIQDLYTKGIIGTDQPITIGKQGDTLIVRNVDLIADLFVGYGITGRMSDGGFGKFGADLALAGALRIGAGEVATFELKDGIHGYPVRVFPITGAQTEGWIVFTAANGITCRYDWTCSANRTEKLLAFNAYGGTGY